MKIILQKILNLLNIHPDKNQRWILICTIITGLLITYSNPTLVKAIISSLPAEWLAFQSLVISVSTLLIGILWHGKIRHSAIKYFSYIAIVETICGTLLGLYLTFVKFNVWIFAITSLVYSSLITIFVGKCIMVFKSKLWNEKGREDYDNNASIVAGITCVIGYVSALLFLPSLKVSVLLWTICCLIENLGWLYVYNLNKKKLVE